MRSGGSLGVLLWMLECLCVPAGDAASRTKTPSTVSEMIARALISSILTTTSARTVAFSRYLWYSNKSSELSCDFP